jgi:hypothetical protein
MNVCVLNTDEGRNEAECKSTFFMPVWKHTRASKRPKLTRQRKKCPFFKMLYLKECYKIQICKPLYKPISRIYEALISNQPLDDPDKSRRRWEQGLGVRIDGDLWGQ